MTERITQQDISRKVEQINNRLADNEAKYRLVVVYQNGWCNLYKATPEQMKRHCVEILLDSGTKPEIYRFLRGIAYRIEL